MGQLFGVYGVSGFGREVMPMARIMMNKDDRIVFIDDNPEQACVNDMDVLNFQQFMNIKLETKNVCISIANSKIRRDIYDNLERNGVHHWSVFSQNSICMDNVDIGENSILAPFVSLTSNIKIGKSFHANLYSYVAHDCVIGDFVTFAPSVKCNGNVHIGDNSYVGTGVIIKQGRPGKPLHIGNNVTISAGAFVTKNIPDGMTVFGNPAVELNRQNIRKLRG
ncbi:acetyltransferase [sulfur-oxidizing endosymbiont of Gigantopelta aegis]|uniref:acetyltransferase n=1 Tax=sulfur-oxidizing endosymbiont of Gigantopelta aegis TaxID=2794934 RepID=UPI0018DE6046|nr:acetyltransferase [sulfur-oxidizing endosymbiont of Gigantopelta aegis]